MYFFAIAKGIGPAKDKDTIMVWAKAPVNEKLRGVLLLLVRPICRGRVWVRTTSMSFPWRMVSVKERDQKVSNEILLWSACERIMTLMV